MKTIKEALTEACEKLKAAEIEEARRDAALLLSSVLNKDRAFLLAHDRDTLDKETEKTFFSYITRRASNEPLQYIIGRQDFFNLEFEVTPDVLIPRPETEILVEAALDILSPKSKTESQSNDKGQMIKNKSKLRTPHSALRTPSVCDVGVGSGCIIVSLLHERKLLRGVGLDISKNALRVAKRNAKQHGVDSRLTFFESDCFDALKDKDFKFDLIVSNPPYIKETDFQTLQSEVKNYEPRIALTPEGDGLRVIKKLLTDAPQFLLPDGYLLIEIGYDQSGAIKELVDFSQWTLIEIRKDLQGIPRTVILKKRSDN